MREIGGYLGFEELVHKEYYPELEALNTARGALLYVLRARRIRKLYIPVYLCRSVSDMLSREGYEFEYYHVGEDFMPSFGKSLADDEYIYVVNYYGRISNDEAVNLKARYSRMILDNVQAFFQKPVPGLDTIYTCRKFFGVPDGAYLSTDSKLGLELETDKSGDRMTHILGRCEGRSASDYYADFKRTDKSYETLPLMRMSWITHNLLGAVDYVRVKSSREDNYRTLDSVLGGSNKLPAVFPEGPFMYPYYCEGGVEVRRKLSEQKVFVPTLWPNVLDCGDDLAEDYAANILPLPCDQRYTREDMLRVAEEVLKCTD